MFRKNKTDERVLALPDADFSARKNRRKRLRVVAEFIVLAFLAFGIYNLFYTLKTYQPYDHSAVAAGDKDTGFVALSYFGVDHIGDTSTIIGQKQLYKHLQELKRQGFVTITQQDIKDYYQLNKPLPEKSLYLMFEDGRRDTAIFAQPILEDLNYKATIMSYGENVESRDLKFLKPSELEELEESTFWELGTNGYRMEYINVFDRYNNYLGEIDPLRYAMLTPYLERRYNHYLMDYIRDKDGVPKESYGHMVRRISYDYERLRDIYTEHFGRVPGAYVHMHGNTGKFANNNAVSAVNEKWIRELFPMAFNREGYCFNQRNSSMYDLTRMQPQPYWPINHLLMRIKYDINTPIEFYAGDTSRQNNWNLLTGAAELENETYTLTTMPEGEALAEVRESSNLPDVKVSVNLLGNAFGAQQIFLRSDSTRQNYLCVELINNELLVLEKANGSRKELYREKIPVILGEKIPSVEENKREAETQENLAFARYATSPQQAEEYYGRAKQREAMPAASVDDGAQPYAHVQSFHRRSTHKLEIALKGSQLSLKLDEKNIPQDITVQENDQGGVLLGASWQGEAWSQRNLADDVYDAVFEKFTITTNTGKDKEKVLFTTELSGWDKFVFRAKETWESILFWFLRNG
ncbi:polysaccharide deacetylase family protein [Selenomonas sp. AE3005]|uniref:polysaccharide deacetylase family protein n=1 Tax=Selenomonas sp. AE3005 TaxID=1485543 RepID=UPI0025E7FA0A|nr:polysaccharide deacetylase family protein [Selenomonas sp. AE3005]